MTRERRRWLLASGLLLVLAALEASARPGGGSSYSGGSSSRSSGSSSRSSGSSSSSSRSSSSSSSSSSGSYSSSGGELDFFTFAVLIVVCGAFVFAFMLVRHVQKDAKHSLDTGGHPVAPRKPLPSRDAVAEAVRKRDPDFSLVLFEDFAYALYAESQRARHDPKLLAGLEPYWTPQASAALAGRLPQGGRVQAVVVGSLREERASEARERLHVEVVFESNLHLELQRPIEGKSALTQYVEEAWTFTRGVAVKTKPWSGVKKLGCPSCGAPYRSSSDARCESCGQASGGGLFDWLVTSVELRRVEAREHSLAGTSQEVGTDSMTLFAPWVKKRREELFREDPGVSPASLEARVRLIFDTLQPAWAAQDLRPVRPFVSDRLYAYLQYWIDAYKEQGLKNLMDQPRLEKLVFARVERDAHYDALTLRIWANGRDYTVEAQSGKVVGGSRSWERRYSEYWTLVRSAKVRGATRLDKKCPSCGAALQVNMAGECEHCSVHVTSGEFDWVLSKIEQDESYRG